MSAGRATRGSLAGQFSALGLPSGRPVLVHASMRALGPVDGGAETVLAALREVVGDQASIVVPAQTADNSTTSPAYREAIRGLPAEEVARYLERMVGFDAATTPSSGMGVLAERVRQDPAAVRSGHPQTSFAAIGPDAAELMRVHDLGCHLGERSPLGALYEADATVLLLGVGFDVCTAFHLAEYRLPDRPTRPYRCFVRDEDGGRRQCDFEDLDLDDGDFDALGAALERADGAAVARGRLGRGPVRALPMRRSVDFAVDWMARNR